MSFSDISCGCYSYFLVFSNLQHWTLTLDVRAVGMRETKYYSYSSIGMRRVCLIYCIMFPWIFISPVKHFSLIQGSVREEIFFSFYSQFGDFFYLVAWFRPKSVAISISQVTAKKKNQMTKKNRIFTTTQTKQHVVKSTFFFFAAANATTSGGGGGGTTTEWFLIRQKCFKWLSLWLRSLFG